MAMVTLNIFSGRQNPSWQMSAEETQIFLAKLKQLKETAQHPNDNAMLGYSGITVDVKCSTENQSWNFNSGVAKKNNLFFADTNRAIETFALKTGEAFLDNALIKEIKNTF